MQEFLNLFILMGPFLFTFCLPVPPSIQASQAPWVCFFFLLLYHLFISLVVSGKESPCSRYRRWEFHHWVKKISWRRARQPTPVFLPGESHGQRSLAGHGSQSHKRVRHDLATQKRLFILLILRLLIIFFMVVEESMGENLSCKKSVNC